MKNALKTTEQFIEESKEKHGVDTWQYVRTEYKGTHKKLIITCSIHGDFKQVAKTHLKGSGCPKCSRKEGASKHKKTGDEFNKEASEVHNNKYDYTKSKYEGSLIRLTIICPIHGDFKQFPSNHLRGAGCKKCAGMENAKTWTRSGYSKQANGRICTFYTLRCFNRDESFYKVGITMETIKKRYNHSVKMPYNYEIISEVFGKANFVWDLEVEEKKRLKEFHYLPKIEFNGSRTECFTQYE